jgi:hypothetical protein
MKFRLVEDFDDLLLEGKPTIEPGSELEKKLIYELENTNKSYAQIAKEYGVATSTLRRFAKHRNLGDKRKFAHAIEPGSDLEKSLIYDIENTNIPFNQLLKKYGLKSLDSIQTIIKTLNLNPIPRLTTVITPGSELEKNLMYDIEHTSTSYSNLAKKYGLTSISPIRTLIKNKNLNVSHRHTSSIEPDSELGKSIIYDLEHTDISFRQLSKKYGISVADVEAFINSITLSSETLKNLHHRKTQKLHLYFNTLEADIRVFKLDSIECSLRFFPSIYIGEYSVTSIEGIYEYVRKKYLGNTVRNSTLFEFYLKIASNEIPLNTLIAELQSELTHPSTYHTSTFDYKFITASTEELSTVDFYSVNYSQLAKDILTLLSRKDNSSNDFDAVYKDLKAAASKVDPETADSNDQIKTYINNNLENIAHNIYSKKGDIIEATNYINGIPYETSFDISSPQDIATCMNKYNGYLLYGFMDKTGDIIYIGISVTATARADKYAEEDRPLILKSFEDKIIRKLIIFKSNLPIQSRTVNTKLIYALEIYFAEHLFKTYPANYPKALNKAKPGQNSSKIVASQNQQKFETYISKQNKLLSVKEFTSAGKELLEVSTNRLRVLYPYTRYAEDYIAKHDGKLSITDKKTLHKSLRPNDMHILWDICSSESEYREIVAHAARPSQVINTWKNYRIKNNLPITEDLDDDIDMEYFI